jgi:hypothetical protein
MRGFGKAQADVNAIPSRSLSPIAKLVFYALAATVCGTSRIQSHLLERGSEADFPQPPRSGNVFLARCFAEGRSL